MIRDSGIYNKDIDRKALFHGKRYEAYLEDLKLSNNTYAAVFPLIKTIIMMVEQKETLKRTIFQAGAFLQEDVELLISIKGVSPLLALSFLADVGDIRRFQNVRKLNAYLGLVPITKASGDRSFQGHIIKKSRALTRTLFTQAVQHIGTSAPGLTEWYKNVRERRGIGKKRNALIRKIIQIMRCMLLNRTVYWNSSKTSYSNKIEIYRRALRSDKTFFKKKDSVIAA